MLYLSTYILCQQLRTSKRPYYLLGLTNSRRKISRLVALPPMEEYN